MSKAEIIPIEMRCRDQWLTWSSIDGKKIPNGKSNTPSTWSSYDKIDLFDNIAFVLNESDPFTGIDLDGCFIDGDLAEWAIPILNRFRGIAYGEVSPSGNGCKLTTKARKPEGSRCKYLVGENKQQIECYDNGRFWTVTSDVMEGFETIGDGQSAVDWLCQTYLSSGGRSTAAKRQGTSAGGQPLSLLQRAQAYADKMTPARKGDLRDSAFRNGGHLHAIVGAADERLSDNDVYHLLRGWNARNVDQLRDDELWEAALNSRKNGTPPADKMPSMSDAAADVSGLVVDQQCNSVTPAEFNQDVRLVNGADVFDEVTEALMNGEADKLFNCGEALRGIEIGPGILTLIGAPPGRGKTALAMQAVYEAVTLEPGLRAVVASLEVTERTLVKRRFAAELDIDYDEIRFNRLSDDQRQLIAGRTDLRNTLAAIDFVPQDSCNLGSMERLVDQCEPGLLLLDYIQLFGDESAEAKVRASQTMSMARRFCAEDWAVVAVSAVARAGYAKSELSSFRDSSAVEYSGAAAYMLDLCEPADADSSPVKAMTLRCLKNRNGKPVDFPLRFIGSKMEFLPAINFMPPAETDFTDNPFDEEPGVL